MRWLFSTIAIYFILKFIMSMHVDLSIMHKISVLKWGNNFILFFYWICNAFWSNFLDSHTDISMSLLCRSRSQIPNWETLLGWTLGTELKWVKILKKCIYKLWGGGGHKEVTVELTKGLSHEQPQRREPEVTTKGEESHARSTWWG